MSTTAQTTQERAQDEARSQLSAHGSSISRKADLVLSPIEGSPDPIRRAVTACLNDHVVAAGLATTSYSYKTLSEAGSLREKIAYVASVKVGAPGAAVPSIASAVTSAISVILGEVEKVVSKANISRDSILRESALTHFDPKLNDKEKAQLDKLALRLDAAFKGTHYGDNLHGSSEGDAQRIFKLSAAVAAAKTAGFEFKNAAGEADKDMLEAVAALDAKLAGLRGYYDAFGAVTLARDAFFEANFSADNGERLAVPTEKEVKKLSYVLERLGAGSAEKYVESKEAAGIQDVEIAAEEFRRKGRDFEAVIASQAWTAEQFTSVFSRYVTQELMFRADAKFRAARLATFGGNRYGEFARDYADRRSQQSKELAATTYPMTLVDRENVVSIFEKDRALFSAVRGSAEYEKFVALLDEVYKWKYPNMYARFAPVPAGAPAGTVSPESRRMSEAILEQNQAEHEALFGEGQTMRVRGQMSPDAMRTAKVHAVSTSVRDGGLPALKSAVNFLNGAIKGAVKLTSATAGAIGDFAEAGDKVLKDDVGSIFTPLKLLRAITKTLSVVGTGTQKTLDKGSELYASAEKFTKEKSAGRLDNPLQVFSYALATLPYGAGEVGRFFSKSAHEFSVEDRQKVLTELFATCNQNGALNEACERVAFHHVLKGSAPRFDVEAGHLDKPTKPAKAVMSSGDYLTKEAPELGRKLDAAFSAWNKNIRSASRALQAVVTDDQAVAVTNAAKADGLAVLGEISSDLNPARLVRALKSNSSFEISRQLSLVLSAASSQVALRLSQLRNHKRVLAGLAAAATKEDRAEKRANVAAAQQAHDAAHLLEEAFTSMQSAHAVLSGTPSDLELEKFNDAIKLIGELPPIA